MPLVVPGLQSKDGQNGDELSQWATKLLGKKIGETHDDITFAKKDLPSKHRVIGPDMATTMDFQPERLNVHVDDQGVVRDVKHG